MGRLINDDGCTVIAACLVKKGGGSGLTWRVCGDAVRFFTFTLHQELLPSVVEGKYNLSDSR